MAGGGTVWPEQLGQGYPRMPEQGLDGGFTAAKGDEQVHGILGATLFQDMLKKTLAGGGVDDKPLLPNWRSLPMLKLCWFGGVNARGTLGAMDRGKFQVSPALP